MGRPLKDPGSHPAAPRADHLIFAGPPAVAVRVRGRAYADRCAGGHSRQGRLIIGDRAQGPSPHPPHVMFSTAPIGAQPMQKRASRKCGRRRSAKVLGRISAPAGETGRPQSTDHLNTHPAGQGSVHLHPDSEGLRQILHQALAELDQMVHQTRALVFAHLDNTTPAEPGAD